MHQGTISCVGMLGQDKQLLFDSFRSFSESGETYCVCCRNSHVAGLELCSIHKDSFDESGTRDKALAHSS